MAALPCTGAGCHSAKTPLRLSATHQPDSPAAPPTCSAIHGAVGRCLKLSLAQPVGHVGLWHQLLGSAPLDAYGGAVGADHGASLNLAVEAARIAAEGASTPSVGKRPPNVGFALAIGQLLHSAATGEQLGAAPCDAEAEQQQQQGNGGEATPPAGGSPPPEQQQQQQQPGEQAEAGASGEPSLVSPADDGSNPLKPKPAPPGFGLRRISSASTIPRVASAAVSDIPDEADSWTSQLAVQLATAGKGGVGCIASAGRGFACGVVQVGGKRCLPGCT